MCVLSYKYKEYIHFEFFLVKRVQRITVLKVYECHPLDITWWIVRSAITRGSCVFKEREHRDRVTHMSANGIYVRDEHHAMNVVSLE